MRIGFTDHAVDRYIQFYTDLEEPGIPLTAEERRAARSTVRALLDAESPNAVKLREKTVRGDTQWRIEALGCLLVTKPDNGEHVCVTILPNHTREFFTQHELEIIEERIAAFHVQEEALRKEVATAKGAVVTAEKSKFKADKDTVVAQAHVRATELAKRLEILQAEVAIHKHLAKTVRHGIAVLSYDRKREPALRAAIRFLVLHASEHPEAAAEAVAKIRSVDRRLLDEDFYLGTDRPEPEGNDRS